MHYFWMDDQWLGVHWFPLIVWRTASLISGNLRLIHGCVQNKVEHNIEWIDAALCCCCCLLPYRSSGPFLARAPATARVERHLIDKQWLILLFFFSLFLDLETLYISPGKPWTSKWFWELPLANQLYELTDTVKQIDLCLIMKYLLFYRN